jgi:hypothetical protein
LLLLLILPFGLVQLNSAIALLALLPAFAVL